MALGKQPFFRAPSVPKMGKKTVSSSIFSSAASVTPRLRTSNFSFINPQQQDSAAQSEILQSQIRQSSKNDAIINSTLTETNRVLVEIQKQLSVDFGSRQNEKRQALAASKAGVQRQRIGAKERAIESVNKIRQGIAKAFDKVTAPARGIFDKIVQFFGTILTGILVNAAWKWLQNPKNRENVGKFFKFIAEHWRWIVRVIVLGKLLGFLYRVYRIVSGLKKGVDLLAKALGLAKNAGKGGGPGGGGINCNEILRCLKTAPEFSTEVITKLVSSGILANTIRSMLPQQPGVSPIPPQLTPQPQRQPAPRLTPQQQYAQSRPGVPSGGYSAANVRRQQENFKPEYYPDINWGAIADWGAFGVAIAFPGEGVAADVLALANLLKNGRITVSALRKILTPKAADAIVDFMRTKGMTPAVARSKGGTIPKSPIQPKETGGKKCDVCSLLPTFSSGGTVGGPGSGNVDSVPAMLAPGEEVIRSAAANLFRPLLKDINDNAGRLWNSFQDAIKIQDQNNKNQLSLAQRFSALLEQFNKELRGLIQKQKLKELRKNPQVGDPGQFAKTNGYGRHASPEQQQQISGSSGTPAPAPAPGGQTSGEPYKPGDTISESATKPAPPAAPASPVFQQPQTQTPETPLTTPAVTPITEPGLEQPKPPTNPFTIPTEPWKGIQTQEKPSTLNLNQFVAAVPKEKKEPITAYRKPTKRTNIVPMPMPPINMAANNKLPSFPEPTTGSQTEVPAINSFDLGNSYLTFTPSEYGIVT